jgi:membrane-bound metal-dependent hydrolase YbcI (DUF457 family)
LDNLTHSLFGLTLARTPLSRAGRGTTAALLLASNAPDIDIVVTATGGAANYLALHRGPTHGPLGVAGLALVVAALVWTGRQRWDRTSTGPPASFLTLWLVSALGVVCHVLMDLPTSYGTRPLSPFSWTWYAVDWMPIVDVYLLAILAGGLWFGGRASGAFDRGRRRRRAATVALSVMALDYGLRAGAHYTAETRAAEAFRGRLPEWCAQSVHPAFGIDWWPRFPETSPRDRAAVRCLVEVAAVPDFVSPFRWRLIAQLSSGYEVRDVDLLTGDGMNGDEVRAPSVAMHVPNHWTPAVARASTAPTARVFLGFSRFPAARSLLHEDGSATVRWNDLRFIGGALDDPRAMRRGLFGATVTVAPDGSIAAHRLGS